MNMNEYSEELILRTMRENDMSYLEAINKLDKEDADRMMEEALADEAFWDDSDIDPFYHDDERYDYEYGWD